MYFSFLLWASISAAIQPGLFSSNVLCFIAIVAIVSFEQINQSVSQSVKKVTVKQHCSSGEKVLTSSAVRRRPATSPLNRE